MIGYGDANGRNIGRGVILKSPFRIAGRRLYAGVVQIVPAVGLQNIRREGSLSVEPPGFAYPSISPCSFQVYPSSVEVAYQIVPQYPGERP